jgi:peptide/nickel transport system substrate-binding protein
MSIRTQCLTVAAAALAATVLASGPALAVKDGGTLRAYHRDNAPSASIHEEATISTVQPFMGVYNNLVMFDAVKPLEKLETIVGDLATSWAWDAGKTKLTFKLTPGVKWHDGKPFSAKDVQCTWDLLLEKSEAKLRKNPRQDWYKNVKAVTPNGDNEVTFELNRPQPAFLLMLASGYTPIYPCHVSPKDMRTNPIGTGPFKFVEWKRNETITLVKNADYFKKGKPHLDGIEWRIIPNRSTRVLAFIAGEFDFTFSADITVPLLKDVKAQAPHAVCELAPQGVMNNLIVNSSAPPFDNEKVRKAMALAIDRKSFIDILSEGNDKMGGGMLPGPEGTWGMPAEVLETLPGYGKDVAKNQADARAIMEGLGYSAAKPLKVKVSTRDIAIYRDPAVILIDQLKKIHIDGELEVVDTSIWHAKVARKDYAVGMNLTGVGVDDPDINFVENYTCNSERNYTNYCNPEVEKLIEQQSIEGDFAKRQKLVWDIERILANDVARPIINHISGATCWQPQVKGFVKHRNSIYNDWRFEDVWLDK